MKHIFCKLFYHEYSVKQKITAFVSEYECVHCGKQFTTSDKGKIIPLTKKRKETNRLLQSLYNKRRIHKQNESVYS